MELEGSSLDVIPVSSRKRLVVADVILNTVGREPIPVHRSRYRRGVPVWIAALGILCGTEGTYEYFFASRTWDRIRELLVEINRQQGTNFKLKRSLSEDDDRARISLVSG